MVRTGGRRAITKKASDLLSEMLPTWYARLVPPELALPCDRRAVKQRGRNVDVGWNRGHIRLRFDCGFVLSASSQWVPSVIISPILRRLAELEPGMGFDPGHWFPPVHQAWPVRWRWRGVRPGPHFGQVLFDDDVTEEERRVAELQELHDAQPPVPPNERVRAACVLGKYSVPGLLWKLPWVGGQTWWQPANALPEKSNYFAPARWQDVSTIGYDRAFHESPTEFLARLDRYLHQAMRSLTTDLITAEVSQASDNPVAHID